ncbi:uncharacterized protein LY89DRAFT_685214 [Mollisia scopiformis]|uniref:GYF domain-containing protein n=1 Tax=Mollisia scopiformis TaxID=149040 RepID=A0A194X7M9_MOLSC|nr:uncharacterized protein LY89DRAFT_685214 [Mollisia scopiformis]KUJ16176.1 hypothetical protein LY89DRAFT_685214 [Mollisia scopiformis]
MPSHMPSSFASAAAGQSSSRDRNGRGDGRGSGDWARRENRPTNGIATFRRPSSTPFAQSTSQAEPPLPTPTTETPISHQPSTTLEQPTDSCRYSRNFLLDIFQQQKESGALKDDISHLYAESWNPEQSSAANGRGWGRSTDGRDNHGPEVCWNKNADTEPMAMQEMTEEERILFSSDVNSPLKPPPQNNKDGGAQGLGVNGRKTSISQGSSAFGLSSPASASRPSTRRQQTSDSISGMQSPSGTGRFSRDEMSPFFARKANEPKDELDERSDEGKPSMLPFGGLSRANTAGSVLGNGPASPWGAPSATSMGNFGNFSLGNSANPPTPIDKRPVFGRGESRLAHLMPKASTEDMSKPAERSWRSSGRQRPDTADTDPFAGEAPSGSAALGGGQDSSPPPHTQPRVPGGMDTPIRGTSGEFGMADVLGFRERGQAQQTPQGHHEEQDQMSPSVTNPYRSPPDDRHDDDSSYDDHPLHHDRQGLGGIPEHGAAFGTSSRGYPNVPYDGSDRSQNSSAGATRGFPPTLSGLTTLSGLGGGGWPTSSNALGTPDRENRPGFPSSAFGSSLFGGMGGDLQSPGFGSHSGMFGASSNANVTGAGRGIRSLFPAAMQAQMQGGEPEEREDSQDMRSSNAFGTIGRNAFPPRDTDSPMRTGRLAFDDFSQSTLSDSAQGQPATGFPQASSAQSNHQPSQASSDSASGTLPAAQMRMMVMPDRMRWVYLDPQGTTQGPWSGLEMHDWYKASFFTADLMVKKVEDEKFEPLGSMIRRIGNSREPFLVPQIGIPHGPPTTTAGAPFVPATAGPGNSSAQPGAVQPPFANSFPSFGTTLTAEQQNNLERRKQEEQFLMARQREFLAQQQVNMKQMQMSGLPSTLHHHSSAHSLQSQPSFGSMTSPIGMPQQPPLPGVAGFFDGPPRPMPAQGATGITPDFFREDELARLSIQERQQLFGPGAQGPQHSVHAQQIASIFGQPQRQATQNEPMDFKARLQEFEHLRAQHEAEEAGGLPPTSAPMMSEPIGPPAQSQQSHSQHMFEEPSELEHEEEHHDQEQEVLSLTQRVQKAASAKESPATVAQPESPWAKVNTGLPMPFPPPPQSTTPLPAPTAQRSRSNLPEALNVEIRSRSETPEAANATPSLAPWAKEPVEAPRGPSLKEIQEAEAKKAAKLETIAAAARRANYEQELKMLASQPVAPAPGLPTTSTWGNSVSPATPTNAPSAWAKPAATKVVAASNVASSKKTLADIQREEELRKQKLAAAAAAAQPTPGVSGGKRYADLASKATISALPPGGSAWSTVGPSGKARVPTGPAAAAPPTARAVSSATVATISAPRAARPAPATRSATTSGQSNVSAAKEEFIRWTKAALANRLNSGINVDVFVEGLTSIGNDPELIADSIYGSTQLMNGNDFAAEFLRRRNQAEKGIVEASVSGYGSASGAGDKSGGWSEVAKKGPPKEEPTAGFKVVPNKKKGKK